jgi:putative ABC transport system substrate-binding protein
LGPKRTSIAPFQYAGFGVGKVLGGTNPGELPIIQPTKFELAINMKTAKALGLHLSNNLLSLADELVE